MDRVPRSLLLGAYGDNLTNVCVALKRHLNTCMCSGCQVFAQAQAIIISEDPKPNEYFDPLSAAEKMDIRD
eukprot:8921470-Karenia_brevis.AAC.1